MLGAEPKLPCRPDDDAVERLFFVALPESQLLLRLALETGLRFGELRRLTWSHVIWERQPHLALEGMKSGRVRRVPLSPEITEMLRLARQRATGLLVIPDCPKSTASLRMRIKRDTGIAFRLHDLRHTFASRYVESGGSLAMLQLILGHASSRMTERYARSTDAPMFADAERVFRVNSGTEVVTPVVTPLRGRQGNRRNRLK